MGEESKIKKATPKQGLETGGLETGGLETGSLSPKDQVAKSYEPDLSGKNGPRARFDALEELISKQIDEFSSNLTFSSGSGTQIFGANGTFAVRTPARRGGSGGFVDAAQPFRKQSSAWDLVVENYETGSVSIRVGSIIKDSSDVTDTLTITNGGASFTVADGSKLFLKITDISVTPGVFTPKCELLVGSTWTDYPSVYEVSNTGASATWAAYYYPLYYFDTNAGSGAEAVADGVYGHKIVESSWFRLGYTIYQSGTDRALTVPILFPSHGPIPP